MENATSNHNDDPEAVKFRRLFIGGLDKHTTEESFRTYFEKWGQVVDCVLMKNNQTTKRSRGFGFITYQSAEQLEDVQKNRPHIIDNNKLVTKRAMPEGSGEEIMASVNKMFVTGLEETTSEEEIREIFAKYGTIEIIHMMKDKNTGIPRRFCFVTFDDYDSVDKCILCKHFPLGSKSIEVKKVSYKYYPMGGSTEGSPGRRSGRGDCGGFDSNYNDSGSGWNQGGFNYGGGYRGSNVGSACYQGDDSYGGDLSSDSYGSE